MFREPGEGHACIFKIEGEKDLNFLRKIFHTEYMKENTTSYIKKNIIYIFLTSLVNHMMRAYI